MKLPIPFLLYVVSLGLLLSTGWTVYQMTPLWKGRDAATRRGQDEGKDAIGRGRGKGPITADWSYTRQSWWAGLKEVNLIGKLPPTPAPVVAEPEKVEVVADLRPLDQLIELVSLVYDGQASGKGGSSHVIVRFKPEANVEPPEWWVRENTAPTPGTNPGGPGPADRTGRPRTPPRGGATPPARPSAMPVSLGGREVLQKVWVDDGGDVRRSSVLWPMQPSPAGNAGRTVQVGAIRLVRVAEDAQSAYFVREVPAGDGVVREPKEERLIKTAMGLSQDVLEALLALQGREASASQEARPAAAPNLTGTTSWMETEETMRVGNRIYIGRQDERRFQQDADQFLAQLNVDTYVGRQSKVTGLIVRGVDPQLQRFGVQVGDVLIEINGRKVESKASAVAQVKGDYNRGVRTFTSKWLVNGQVVDRTYTAPDR